MSPQTNWRLQGALAGMLAVVGLLLIGLLLSRLQLRDDVCVVVAALLIGFLCYHLAFGRARRRKLHRSTLDRAVKHYTRSIARTSVGGVFLVGLVAAVYSGALNDVESGYKALVVATVATAALLLFVGRSVAEELADRLQSRLDTGSHQRTDDCASEESYADYWQIQLALLFVVMAGGLLVVGAIRSANCESGLTGAAAGKPVVFELAEGLRVSAARGGRKGCSAHMRVVASMAPTEAPVAVATEGEGVP